MLLDEQHGNYVIQHVLQHGRVQDRQSLLGIVVASGILTLPLHRLLLVPGSCHLGGKPPAMATKRHRPRS